MMQRSLIRRSTARQVLDAVRERIVSGAYPSGEKLDEARLAAELGVSRTPLREALAQLERDGLITHEPHRGRLVAPCDADGVRQSYPILAAYEALAVRLTPRFDAAALASLNAANDAILEPALDGRGRHARDRAFHDALCAACGNARLLELIDREKSVAARYDGGARRGLLDAADSHHDHAAVIAALARDDRDAAVAALTRHWEKGAARVAAWSEAASETGD